MMSDEMVDSRPLRVCYFGTYRANYARNRIMIEGLRRNGVEVIECHEQLWHGIEDRVQAVAGGWKHPRFWWRVVRAYGRLVRRYLALDDHDILVVGYPGQFDVYLAYLLSRLRGTPLVWDIFMSIYLIAVERELHRRSATVVTVLRLVERYACRLPDLLVLDTEAYVAWFGERHGVPSDRFQLVPTGADTDQFHPADDASSDDRCFRAVYYGTFIRNHGVEHIVEAARLLADDKTIHFELIGDGPEKGRAESLVREYDLSNVTFVGWLDQGALRQRVARADVCLGVFGTTPQSMMTVQNKIYEGLAMARPVVTGDSPTVQITLRHGEEVYLCDRANPDALASAIRALKENPAQRTMLAHNGYQRVQQSFRLQRLGALYKEHLLHLLA